MSHRVESNTEKEAVGKQLSEIKEETISLKKEIAALKKQSSKIEKTEKKATQEVTTSPIRSDATGLKDMEKHEYILKMEKLTSDKDEALSLAESRKSEIVELNKRISELKGSADLLEHENSDIHEKIDELQEEFKKVRTLFDTELTDRVVDYFEQESARKIREL